MSTFDELRSEIRRALQRLGTPAHMIEDLIQEVFLASVAHPEPQEPILRQARNARSKLRSGEYRIESLAVREGDHRDARQEPPSQEEKLLVSEVLNRLTPLQREVLLLIYYEGLTNPEVAERLGKTTDSIAGLKRAALDHAAKIAMHKRGFRKHIVPIAPPSDGGSLKRRWSACLGAGLYGFSAVVTPEDELVVVGWSHGPAVIGGAELRAEGPLPWNLWLVRTRPNAESPSVAYLASAVDPRGQSIALLDARRLVVAASFEGAIEGGPSVSDKGHGPNDAGVMVTVLDLSGGERAFSLVRRFGKVQRESLGVVTDAAGNIVVPCLLRAPDEQGYLLRLDRYDQRGARLKSWEHACSGEARGWMVSRAGDGLLVAGVFDGEIKFGPDRLKQHRKNELFLAKLDPSGACAWVESFHGSAGQWGWAACADREGSVFVAAYFRGTIHLSDQPLKSKSRVGYDLVVAKLNASGRHLWSACYPGTETPLPLSIAAADGGGVLVIGHLNGVAGAASADADVVGSRAGASSDTLHLAKLGPGGDLRGCRVVARAPDAVFGNEMISDGAGGVSLSVYLSGEDSVEFYVMRFVDERG